ncbi:response regulator transcription factor [Salisediminibacterium beveridgei]|uniref:Two-component response regulator n=1 Tax=Salisediminibacterium beveridgei TaxID=632773 RepID=A0A1D7QRW9_9BACI|nr:response regulator transcription factor [Salisediminibacterium beveridgei]AOM81764.1 Two-component response regulator [Salisediminibacterium beveridgei]
MTKTKKVLIVDDEADLREMTSKFLNSKGYEVVTAQDGDEALSKTEAYLPDLIVLDIEMPEQNGFEVCERIREQKSIPIIFLSVRRHTIDKVKCFELGGDDYMTKPFDFEELEARIKANIRIYEKNPEDQNEILDFGRLKIDLNHYQCYVNDEPVALTAKEMKLLMHLATNPNQVWTHEQLYDQIWDLNATGFVETVKVHISHLRSKIEARPNQPVYIQTVRGFGYRFSTGSEKVSE